MPRDLVWTMECAGKGKQVVGLNSFAVRVALVKLRPRIMRQGGLVTLIMKYDRKKDGNISDHDLRLLVQACTCNQRDCLTSVHV